MRIGIIGCGEISHAHARFILRDKKRRLVAVCDTNREKGRAFAKNFGVDNSYSDVSRLLGEHQLDAVHILTPPQSHTAIAVAAMGAGCNVLVEKPMAISTEEADAMVEVARRNDVRLCVNHNQLFEPVMLKAFRFLQEKAIGDVISVESHYSLTFIPDPARPWVETLPGGIFQNLAPHPLYLILEFIGDPVEMHSSTLNTGALGVDTPDELRIVMRGERAMGYVALSIGTRPNVNCLRISGTRATIHVDFAGKTIRLERLRSLPKAVARGLMNLELAGQLSIQTFSNAAKLLFGRLKSYQGHGNLIDAFYRSIEHQGPLPVSVEAARRVVEVYDRVRTEVLGPPLMV
jgi:predicted dehydrogenase